MPIYMCLLYNLIQMHILGLQEYSNSSKNLNHYYNNKLYNKRNKNTFSPTNIYNKNNDLCDLYKKMYNLLLHIHFLNTLSYTSQVDGRKLGWSMQLGCRLSNLRRMYYTLFHQLLRLHS